MTSLNIYWHNFRATFDFYFKWVISPVLGTMVAFCGKHTQSTDLMDRWRLKKYRNISLNKPHVSCTQLWVGVKAVAEAGAQCFSVFMCVLGGQGGSRQAVSVNSGSRLALTWCFTASFWSKRAKWQTRLCDLGQKPLLQSAHTSERLVYTTPRLHRDMFSAACVLISGACTQAKRGEGGGKWGCSCPDFLQGWYTAVSHWLPEKTHRDTRMRARETEALHERVIKGIWGKGKQKTEDSLCQKVGETREIEHRKMGNSRMVWVKEILRKMCGRKREQMPDVLACWRWSSGETCFGTLHM